MNQNILPVVGCCGTPVSAEAEPYVLPSANQPCVAGTVATPIGEVPRVEARLRPADKLGGLRVRLGIGRMNYSVEPGLYALGNPGPQEPVFVTANYKLSFDHLRSSLEGRHCWLLVLDTRGVNVWCAAGKGTFGTDELVGRIRSSGLERVVDHRTVIVPQLGATGVAAHQVRRSSGFRVIFGPVRAADLRAFVDAGLKATAEMRSKRFPLAERVAVIGVELVHVLRYFPLLAAAVFFLAGLGFGESYWPAAARHGGYGIAALGLALFAGVILTPVLLPWLPGPAFSAKGLQAALLTEVPLFVMRPANLGIVEAAGWLLIGLSFASFLAMNFTGASTYTSLSGVRKEIRLSVPLQVAGAAGGLVCVIIAAVAG